MGAFELDIDGVFDLLGFCDGVGVFNLDVWPLAIDVHSESRCLFRAAVLETILGQAGHANETFALSSSSGAMVVVVLSGIC